MTFSSSGKRAVGPRFGGLVVGAIVAGVFSVVVGCVAITRVGTGIGMATGHVDENQAAALERSAEAVERSFEDFTPEQEHYIGRAVGAEILSRYEPFDESKVNEYLNKIGQSLAMASDRPEIFAGYRFVVLDTDEVNAFASPNGLVMVTRGILRLTDSEDGVAAILAHEIGHIEHKHGLAAIRTSRVTAALTSAAITGVRVASSEEIAELTDIFENSIEDITSTLIDSGYSRGAEREADRAAVRMMQRLNYDPDALLALLEEMDAAFETKTIGLARTHPAPSRRIRVVERAMRDHPKPPAATQARQERYERLLGAI